MPLQPGTALGPYEVTGPIGQGGMGEVYQARDTKLDRDVALKVLPEAFTSDPDRLARFEREAKVLASLNHPNIGSIYGLEEADGVKALVLELIEGPTLADRIQQGPIPVDEALPIAKQIAEALEAAHEAGVIHRDLKPANIKVREDGTVKVLDFGLAKALDPAPATDPDQSPTLTAAATQMGVIMGTAAYMSPEQVAGKRVDTRSDVWSFGVVLLEMLTGERLFTGETVSHVLAQVLERDPDLATLPDVTPTAIYRLIDRCLRKDRHRRLQSIGDARVEIEEAFDESPQGNAGSAATEDTWATSRRSVAAWLFGGVAAILTVALVVTTDPSAGPELPLRKSILAVPDGLARMDMVAISPNGQMVAYTRERRLWIQRLDELEPLALTGSVGVRGPFWSPDSSAVAYFSEGELRRTPVTGGPSTAVCDVPGEFQGGSWGTDGTIVFAQTEYGLSEVSDQGGDPRAIEGGSGYAWDAFAFPHLLPDGKGLLRFLPNDDGSGAIVVESDGVVTPVVDAGRHVWGVAYSPTGHILYGRGWPQSEGLFAVPFSLDSLSVTGEPFLIDAAGNLPSVSDDGTLVYGIADDLHRLVWVTRDGRIDGTIGQPQGVIWEPTLSPDGRFVAVQGHEPESIDIYVHDVERGTKTRLTFDPTLDDEPAWSPDGQRLVFTSLRLTGSHDLFIMNVDGTGEIEPLVTGPSLEHAPNWSRDGRYIAYHVQPPGMNGRDVWYLDLEDPDNPMPFLQAPFEELVPQMSPDGRHLAYQSNEQGRWDVFIVDFPAGGGKRQVSVDGGMHPRWSPDGAELFYVEGDTVMAVAVTTEPELRLGEPERLFTGADLDLQLNPGFRPDFPNYNVGLDGERFIAVQSMTIEGRMGSRIVVVQNWSEELQRLVPTN